MAGSRREAWIRMVVNRKVSRAMAGVGAAVVVIDGLAVVSWPAHGMGGVVAKMLLFALAVFELVPTAGFAGLATWLRSKPVGSLPAVVFFVWTAFSVPVMALGAYVGISALLRWGLF